MLECNLHNFLDITFFIEKKKGTTYICLISLWEFLIFQGGGLNFNLFLLLYSVKLINFDIIK